MIDSDYLNIISEFYDLSDPYTLENTILCSEDDKSLRLEHITNKLYNHIRNNVDNIDFGTIPLSKGDITKIDNYPNLIDCINTMTELIREYDQPLDQINVLSTAVNNIQERKAMFVKSFAMNIEYPVMMYNVMTLSIVSSMHLLIVTCVEYIKNKDDSISAALDKAAYKKSREHVLFKSLMDFNTMCTKGDFDKLVATSIKNNVTTVKEHYEKTGQIKNANRINSINEGLISGLSFFAVIVGAGCSIKVILSVGLGSIRRVTYYFLEMRQNISDYFAAEADFLQINAENLKYKDKYENNEEERKKVYNKQMKWVDRFRKWANIFMIKDKKAQADSKKKEEEDSKKEKHEDEKGGNGNDNDDDGGIF